MYRFPGVGMPEKRLVWDEAPKAGPDAAKPAVEGQKQMTEAQRKAAEAAMNQADATYKAAMDAATRKPAVAQNKPSDSKKQPTAAEPKMATPAAGGDATNPALRLATGKDTVKPGEGGLQNVGNSKGSEASAGETTQVPGPTPNKPAEKKADGPRVITTRTQILIDTNKP